MFFFSCYFSQIIDGLLHLKDEGKYHGNFSLNNTLYHLSGNELVIKLTDFVLKGILVLSVLFRSN